MNKYKRIEQEIDRLVLENRSTTYDIAVKVVALLKDADKYAAAIGIAVEDVSSHLESRFLTECPLGLEELTILVEHRPDRAQWARPLRVVYDEVAAGLRSVQPQREVAQRTRVTRKELEEAQDRAKSAEAETRHLREQISSLTDENRRLVRENAHLEGRISELERVSRGVVGAA